MYGVPMDGLTGRICQTTSSPPTLNHHQRLSRRCLPRRQTLNDARKVVLTIITKPRHVLSRPRVQRRQSLRTRRPAPPYPPQTIPSLPPSPSATFKISLLSALTNLDQSPDNSDADVSAAVEDLLNTLSNKFASVSSEIFAKSEFHTKTIPFVLPTHNRFFSPTRKSPQHKTSC